MYSFVYSQDFCVQHSVPVRLCILVVVCRSFLGNTILCMHAVDDVMEVLLEVAKFRCRSTPESSLIVQLISRLADSEESAFQRLLNVMVSIQDDLLYC